MKTIFGFLAAKLGFSCSGSSSRKFIDGYMLGAGITVGRFSWQSKEFGKQKTQLSIYLFTRKEFGFGVKQL